MLDRQVGGLQSGKVTISAEDNTKVEKRLSGYMTAWQRRKRMFNDIWCVHNAMCTFCSQAPTAVLCAHACSHAESLL